MRCRDVEALWDELRGECQASLKETVHSHLRACPSCQAMYEEYEGVAYCLSCSAPSATVMRFGEAGDSAYRALKGKHYPPIVLAALHDADRPALRRIQRRRESRMSASTRATRSRTSSNAPSAVCTAAS